MEGDYAAAEARVTLTLKSEASLIFTHMMILRLLPVTLIREFVKQAPELKNGRCFVGGVA